MSAVPAIAQECVEGYLFVRDPPRLLILRRPPARESIWVPVSGKVEPRDADLTTAMRRELREETGFARVTELFDLEWVVPFEGPDGRPWQLHAFGIALDAPREPTLSDEHVEAAWLPLEVAQCRLHYADNREAVERLKDREGWRTAPPERL